MILAMVAMVAGCETQEAPPFELVFAADATTEQVSAVMDAADDWNERANVDLFYQGEGQRSERSCNTIYVSFMAEDDFATSGIKHRLAALHTDKGCFHTIAYAKRGLNDPATIRHELGHALGLDDDQEDRNSVMFWVVTDQSASITDADVSAVKAHWNL